jgi:hypothetical protein
MWKKNTDSKMISDKNIFPTQLTESAQLDATPVYIVGFGMSQPLPVTIYPRQ